MTWPRPVFLIRIRIDFGPLDPDPRGIYTKFTPPEKTADYGVSADWQREIILLNSLLSSFKGTLTNDRCL
jgi:hypothetical protein